MKAYFKGLNSCLQRKFSIQQYKDLVANSGFEIVDEPIDADKIFIWTCAFRKDYCTNSLNIVSDFVRLYGEDRIVVCGCLPAIDERLLKDQYGGAYFKWRDDAAFFRGFLKVNKHYASARARPIIEENFTLDINRYRKENPEKNASYYDQFIKVYVSEGCLYDCTYCSEKLAFPPFKSYRLEDILEGCKKMTRQCSTKRIALLADSLGSYGSDIGTSLDHLISAILGIDQDVRIGLMNLHPSDFIRFHTYLMNLIAAHRIFLLSVPIQSASDRILRLMNRPYVRNDLDTIFRRLSGFGFKELETHIIIGFPSETVTDFAETVDFLVEHQPKYVMASSYMESPSMPSFALGNKIDSHEIHRRTLLLVEKMKNNKIICNYDNCEYFADHINRIKSCQGV
jgi:threonylcarbamoyladenosine tRNA methylthiotransferase MtaB